MHLKYSRSFLSYLLLVSLLISCDEKVGDDTGKGRDQDRQGDSEKKQDKPRDSGLDDLYGKWKSLQLPIGQGANIQTEIIIHPNMRYSQSINFRIDFNKPGATPFIAVIKSNGTFSINGDKVSLVVDNSEAKGGNLASQRMLDKSDQMPPKIRNLMDTFKNMKKMPGETQTLSRKSFGTAYKKMTH